MTMQSSEKVKGNGKKSGKEAVQDEVEMNRGTTPGSADTKALWGKVRELEGQEAQHQQKLDILLYEKSDLLKQLQDSLGSGPFKVNGKVVEIRSRKSKIEGKPDLHFFVTRGERTVTVIE